MRVRNGTFHYYFYCRSHDPLRAGGELRRCPERNNRADELDAFVFDQIRATMLRPDVSARWGRPRFQRGTRQEMTNCWPPNLPDSIARSTPQQPNPDDWPPSPSVQQDHLTVCVPSKMRASKRRPSVLRTGPQHCPDLHVIILSRAAYINCWPILPWSIRQSRDDIYHYQETLGGSRAV
jgi:hypothetical protein